MEHCFVHESSYIDDNVLIGEGTKIWYFSHIQEGAVIGKGCSIGQNVNIARGVHIGDHVKIQNNVSVYEGVTVEDNVFLGPSCVFTNVLSPRTEFPKDKEFYGKTVIKHGASVGANATIVCGNSIGCYALIGAGAVVIENVKNHALMMGVPARQNGWVCKCGQTLKAGFQCEVCRRRYTETEDGLLELQMQIEGG